MPPPCRYVRGMEAKPTEGNQMKTHSIEYANWIKTGIIPAGCFVIAGTASNEILKDATGWTRAVRPAADKVTA